MEEINSCIQKALKADRILPRPEGSPGAWLAFLLPSAVIVTALRAPDVSEIYLSTAIYSFNLLLNALLLLHHVHTYKSASITKNLNILLLIPGLFTVVCYTHLLNLGLSRSIYFTIANGIIYFEGILFLLKAFPKAFTFGEANVAIQGFSLFIYGLFLKLYNILLEEIPISDCDISTFILQISFAWIAVFCIVPFVNPLFRHSAFVYLWTLVIVGLIYFSIFSLLNLNFIFWIWSFCTKPERIGVILLWSICSATAVVVVQNQINTKKKSNSALRKYFHVLAVIVFLSGILLDVNLIYFSSGCVFELFIVLESFRILNVPPFHEFLQQGFKAYSDEKDTGNLAVTPICLLVGLSLPLWLHPSKEFSNETQIQLLSGIISVGIGDTFASLGGQFFGKHKWKGSSKTIEGTVSCILSQMLFIQTLVFFGFLQNSLGNFVKSLIAIFITSLVEAKTDQIDNIVLPLTMYILLVV